jgi:hypothetical protein
MRQGAKGLLDAEAKVEGADATLAIALPIDAKTLRSEIANLIRLSGGEGGGNGCFPFPGFLTTTTRDTMTVPSAQYLQHPPQFVPAEHQCPQSMAPYGTVPLCVPGMAMTIPVPPSSLPPTSVPPPPLPSSSPAVGALPPPSVAPPPPTPLPAVAVTTVAATLPAAPKAMKLAVANVRKESALLFTMSDGKLTFVQKVPPGSAVDVPAAPGQRWVVVFPDNPAGETFAPSQPESVWLLR